MPPNDPSPRARPVHELPTLIQGLLNPHAYGHPAGPVRLLETHISWVLLTGTFAYKIKKPVHLSFLDFSTLERRRAACLEELRLNRRLAPTLYLDVVAISGTPEDPQIDDVPAEAIEWAVKMQQFAQEDLVSNRLAAGRLEPSALERFAVTIADFHESLPPADPESPYGTPEVVHAPALGNFKDLLRLAADDAERSRITALRQWTERRFAMMQGQLQGRKDEGRIREGHGDLHLANLVFWQDRIVAFDCLEFDPALRWGDAIADVAFLVMDLLRRGRTDLSYRFLNAYLERNGDYAGIRLLRYYVIYRALVRAKVGMIQRSTTGADRPAAGKEVGEHLDQASRLLLRAPPMLLLMHGLSGSGKSHISSVLMAALPAVRIRSDVERKRLHGLEADARSGSDLEDGLYSKQASARTYARLEHLARAVLEGEESVIVDATFLLAAQREAFRRLAGELGVRYAVLRCHAPDHELRRRIQQRMQQRDASEADLAVLDAQMAHAEPFHDEERTAMVEIDTLQALDTASVLTMIDAAATIPRFPTPFP